ncbi:MAG: DUF1559 domain-containing protein [Planctomycetales bacterium]
MNDQTRRGFTLTELLVAISIIGLLLALILPAVQAARESARRAQCQARLKDFGNALHGYESTFRIFPAAQRATTTQPVLFSIHFYSPHVYLLPHFDQMAVASKIDVQSQQTYFWDPEGLPDIAKTPIVAFQCPSDPAPAGNSYRFCLGTGPGTIHSVLTPGGDGPFEALMPHSAADIRDGLSHTIAVSEKRKARGNRSRFEQEAYWHSGIANVSLPIPEVDEMVSLCGSLRSDPVEFQPFAGLSWYLAAYDFTWYNHAVTPNSQVFDCSAQSFSPTAKPGDGVFKASSHHSGGVQCAFMDGHTSFISDAIDLKVWRALSTRAGAEILSDADF